MKERLTKDVAAKMVWTREPKAYSVFEDRIEIHLNDNGPGIANIDLAMQEGFSTAPDNIRSLGFGAGMGLPNMKRYSDSITIDSALGKGTKILMTVNLS